MDVLAEVNQDVANFVPRRSNGHYTQSPQLVSTLRTGMKLEVTKTGQSYLYTVYSVNFDLSP